GLCLAHCWGSEATGPFCSDAGGTSGVSFVPASGGFRPFVMARVFVGCAGWGCWLTGLLFENYIVDASIEGHAPVWVCVSYSNFL
ncbi:hypothetical protein SB847_21070, partial [Bacillus sp. SIMBA_026]|uniref:hypothetical protein n=1 Tax=Bacillus sp. SIMBA_026 TaxID=3085769 RepID=UPI00397D2960